LRPDSLEATRAAPVLTAFLEAAERDASRVPRSRLAQLAASHAMHDDFLVKASQRALESCLAGLTHVTDANAVLMHVSRALERYPVLCAPLTERVDALLASQERDV